MNKQKRLIKEALHLLSVLIGLLFRALVVSLELDAVLREIVTPPPQVGVLKGNVQIEGDISQTEGTVVTLYTLDGVAKDTASVTNGTFEFNEQAIGEYLLNANKNLEPVGFIGLAGGVPIPVTITSEGMSVTLQLVRAHHHRREGHAEN
jgi:hypothetical protein